MLRFLALSARAGGGVRGEHGAAQQRVRLDHRAPLIAPSKCRWGAAGWFDFMLGMSPGRDLPRRLPNVADRRLLERRRGADASLAGSCGGGEPGPGADVAGVRPASCRCGRGQPCPSADVAGESPVEVQMRPG